MPARRRAMESVPPTLQPQQAVKLLRTQLEKLRETTDWRHGVPRVDGWESTTIGILNGAFGKPNGDEEDRTRQFRAAQYHVSYAGMPESERQANYLRGQATRKVLLEAYIEQLQILAPPSAITAPEQYQFHAEIERVSGTLYRDGHYREAALNAYIRVIEEVRKRSGLDEDGDRLMNRAFGCENQTPAIQFNSLQSEPERDEQKGFMYLYKGLVGLRNFKAHTTQFLDDPRRAHDYLAFASLLMRVVDIAQINIV